MSENPGPASPGTPRPGDDEHAADTGPGPDPADVDAPGTTRGPDLPDEPDEG